MPLGYSTVRVNVGALIIDGVDEDDQFDDVPVTGNMVLTPMLDPAKPVQVDDGGTLKIKAIAPFEVEIGLTGQISHRNRDYVTVPAPTSLTSNLSMLQWRASFNGLKYGSKAVTVPPIYFWAEPGLQINLAEHINVGPNSTALQLSRGPRGFGIGEVEADGAELVFLSEADGAPEIGRVTLPPHEAVVGADSITEAELADGGVTGPKIAQDAVTASKLANGAVARAKLADVVLTELDGKLSQTAADNRYASTSLVDMATLVATADRFPGLDPTGTAGSTAALQAAVDATPDGAMLVIPAGTYLLPTPVLVTDRAITVWAYGCTFNATEEPFKFRTTPGSLANVTSIASVTITNDASSQPGTTLTLDTARAWVVGDIVKIVSDDIVEGGRAGDGTLESRNGQFLVVDSVAGNDVTCAGVLRDTYTANVRAARIPTKTSHLHGGSFTQGLPTTFYGMVGPLAADHHVVDSGAVGISFVGCYAHRTTGLKIDHCDDVPSQGKYGYGIADISSSHGVHIAPVVQRARHAYTDDTKRIAAGSVDIEYYGRSFSTKVINGVGRSCTNTVWDTHACSENTQFIDCDGIDSPTLFGLRGRRHKARGRAISCGMSWQVFSESAGSNDSWGHDIEVETIRPQGSGTVGRLLLNHGASDPKVGIRETRPTTVRMNVREMTANCIEVTNGTLLIERLSVTAAATLNDASTVVKGVNADIRSSTPIRLDYNANTAGAGIKGFDVDATSRLDIAGLAWNWPSGMTARIDRILTCPAEGPTIRIVDAVLAALPAVLSSFMPVTGVFDWRLFSGADNSGWLLATGTQLADVSWMSQIARSIKDTMYVRASVSGGSRTLAALPPGAFLGQQLVIFVAAAGGNTLTINHGTAAKTSLVGSVAKVLGGLGTCQLFWDGSNWTEKRSASTGGDSGVTFTEDATRPGIYLMGV